MYATKRAFAVMYYFFFRFRDDDATTVGFFKSFFGCFLVCVFLVCVFACVLGERLFLLLFCCLVFSVASSTASFFSFLRLCFIPTVVVFALFFFFFFCAEALFSREAESWLMLVLLRNVCSATHEFFFLLCR